MDFNTINRMLICPIFFFLGLVMLVMVGVSMYAAIMMNTAYVVVSCVLFVLGYNAVRVGWTILKVARFTP